MAAWANALVTISGGRRRCLPMGLFGSWSAGLPPASPVALVPAVMVGGDPLGCLAALFRKLGRRHSCDILPADALFFVWSRRKGLMGVKGEP